MSWHNRYADQLSYFAEHGYRAIAFDRRGWGKSEAIPTTGEQPGSLAGDLDALIDALGLDRVHVVGVAGGSFSAIDYAHWRPERLKSVVAAATMLAMRDGEIGEFVQRARIDLLRAPAPQVYLEVSAGYRGSNPEGTAFWVDLEEHARQPEAPSQPLRTPNNYDKLSEIKTPVFALAGGADLIAPPKLMQLWAAQLENHEVGSIDGAGHSVAFEEPDEFNRRVYEFIQRYES